MPDEFKDTVKTNSSEPAFSNVKNFDLREESSGEKNFDYLGEFIKLKKQVKDSNDALDKLIIENKDTKSYTVYGFIALVFVVIAITFSYIEFVYSGSRNDDYKYNLTIDLMRERTDLDYLKNCLKSSGWLNPICLEK